MSATPPHPLVAPTLGADRRPDNKRTALAWLYLSSRSTELGRRHVEPEARSGNGVEQVACRLRQRQVVAAEEAARRVQPPGDEEATALPADARQRFIHLFRAVFVEAVFDDPRRRVRADDEHGARKQ